MKLIHRKKSYQLNNWYSVNIVDRLDFKANFIHFFWFNYKMGLIYSTTFLVNLTNNNECCVNAKENNYICRYLFGINVVFNN